MTENMNNYLIFNLMGPYKTNCYYSIILSRSKDEIKMGASPQVAQGDGGLDWDRSVQHSAKKEKVADQLDDMLI